MKCFNHNSPLGGREPNKNEVLIRQKLEQLSKITVSRRSSSERGAELSMGNRTPNNRSKGGGKMERGRGCRRTGENCKDSAKGCSIGSAKRGQSKFSSGAKGTDQKMLKKNGSGRSKAKI